MGNHVSADIRIEIHAFSLCTRSIAKELADWLINNNVVEHIFGPNLHIEVSWKNKTRVFFFCLHHEVTFLVL